MKWDETLDRIAKIIAVKVRVEEFYVKDVVEHVIKSTKDALRSPDMPTVKWPKFGKFFPVPERLKRRIIRYIKAYKEGKRPRDHVQWAMENLNPVKRRLFKERKRKKRKHARIPESKTQTQILA